MTADNSRLFLEPPHLILLFATFSWSLARRVQTKDGSFLLGPRHTSLVMVAQDLFTIADFQVKMFHNLREHFFESMKKLGVGEMFLFVKRFGCFGFSAILFLLGCSGPEGPELTDDGVYKVVKAAGWNRIKNAPGFLAGNKDCLITKENAEFFLLFYPKEKNGFGSATEVAKYQMKLLRAGGESFSGSGKKVTINGFPAIQVIGTNASEASKSLFTFMELEEEYVTLVGGCERNRFGEFESDFFEMAASFGLASGKQPKSFNRGQQGTVESRDGTYKTFRPAHWAIEFSRDGFDEETDKLIELYAGSSYTDEWLSVIKIDSEIEENLKELLANKVAGMKQAGFGFRASGKPKKISIGSYIGYQQLGSGSIDNRSVVFRLVMIRAGKDYYEVTLSVPDDFYWKNTDLYDKVISDFKFGLKTK